MQGSVTQVWSGYSQVQSPVINISAKSGADIQSAITIQEPVFPYNQYQQYFNMTLDNAKFTGTLNTPTGVTMNLAFKSLCQNSIQIIL
ncbi:hypothetical protein [Helicobacter sp. 11S03491-1]|uniref:hypothetical protein n=1 Tax=Helicobacter sp. 11S03491-1 TaxID=1476196 RepID=UPI000BA606B8|nr:hypothetical protein [Helicobacter sp. 11S03491-1]PAF41052.1 hypothetical protein BKH45_08520 [Helicobacter sp. 11S03491-1]